MGLWLLNGVLSGPLNSSFASFRLRAFALMDWRNAETPRRQAETTSSFAPLRLRAFALNDWMAVESTRTRSRFFPLACRQPHPVRIVLPAGLGGELVWGERPLVVAGL